MRAAVEHILDTKTLAGITGYERDARRGMQHQRDVRAELFGGIVLANSRILH